MKLRPTQSFSSRRTKLHSSPAMSSMSMAASPTDPIRARRFAPRPVKGGAVLPRHPCRSRFAAQVPGALCPARLDVPVRVRRFSAFRFRIAEQSGDTIMSDLFRKAALVTGASLEAIPPACRLEELERKVLNRSGAADRKLRNRSDELSLLTVENRHL